MTTSPAILATDLPLPAADIEDAAGVEKVRDLVKSRIRADRAFGHALLAEAIEVLLTGDLMTARSVLADYIEATIGFAELASQSGLGEAQLGEMFVTSGDPRAVDLLGVIGLLQRQQGIRLAVSVVA